MKNYFVFGFMGISSILGMTLYLTAGPEISRFSKEELEEVLLPIVSEKPEWGAMMMTGYMRKISEYEQKGVKLPVPEWMKKEPALQRHEKKGWWGASNKNAAEYLVLSKKFEKLSFRLIRDFPENYYLNVIQGAVLWFKPSWTFASATSFNPAPWIHLPRLFHLPEVDSEWKKENVIIAKGWDAFPLFLMIAFVGSLIQAFQGKRGFLLSAAYVFIVGYNFLTTILITNLETMRYKFEIELLTYVVGLLFLTRFVAWTFSIIKAYRSEKIATNGGLDASALHEGK